MLDNRKGQAVARGFYDPNCPVAFRVCETNCELKLDERWAERELKNALSLRAHFTSGGLTTGCRLINGEGDGLPGLVIDQYGETGVLKLDGEGPVGFWNSAEVAARIAEWRGLNCLFERRKERGAAGRALVGETPAEPVRFLENGISFTADVLHGQKTGFFLDQRDNRQLIRQRAAGLSVLNVFSYTGGFSVSAGRGGAASVTSVDLAPAAIDAANQHWQLNDLPNDQHAGFAVDAFDFLSDAAQQKQRWGLVILDPPSFAPNRESVPKATAAYQNLIEAGARVTERRGLLAVASCSSHIDMTMFLNCCEEGVSKARRRGQVLVINGQPEDHPSPLALPEFRYLKFVLLRLD